MQKIDKLNVFYHGRKVGTLALYKRYLAAFQYDKAWLHEGFSISPFSLPPEDQVFLPKREPFEGLFGVFADSLPDGWGRLLVDRLLIKNRLNPHEFSALQRLALVGSSGMGALTYEPEISLPAAFGKTAEYDFLVSECQKVLSEQTSDDLDTLFLLGGSSGGARPKILTQIDGESWIIKFPALHDAGNIGAQEYDYSMCAKECGIQMPETHLFPSKHCDGYFGVKRFDRVGSGSHQESIHMVSVSALLETSHRIPNLDYDLLLQLTLELTKDFTEVEKLYRLMCFNVFAHNRDDHSKNFSYLYMEDERRWVLAPAYDLTYSSSLGGEHATMIHGNGANPDRAELLAAAESIGISRRKAAVIADEIRECVSEMLHAYL